MKTTITLLDIYGNVLQTFEIDGLASINHLDVREYEREYPQVAKININVTL